jgi:hypothetical protein
VQAIFACVTPLTNTLPTLLSFLFLPHHHHHLHHPHPLLQVTRLLLDHYIALSAAPGSTHAGNVDTAAERVEQALNEAAFQQLGDLAHILATSGTSKNEWEGKKEQVEALLGPAEGLLQVTPEEYLEYGPFHD